MISTFERRPEADQNGFRSESVRVSSERVQASVHRSLLLRSPPHPAPDTDQHNVPQVQEQDGLQELEGKCNESLMIFMMRILKIAIVNSLTSLPDLSLTRIVSFSL